MRLSDVDVTFKRRPGALTFELSTTKTDIVFKAPNEEEFELWVKSIQRIVVVRALSGSVYDHAEYECTVAKVFSTI